MAFRVVFMCRDDTNAVFFSFFLFRHALRFFCLSLQAEIVITKPLSPLYGTIGSAMHSPSVRSDPAKMHRYKRAMESVRFKIEMLLVAIGPGT